jgi:hypothetical protein
MPEIKILSRCRNTLHLPFRGSVARRAEIHHLREHREHEGRRHGAHFGALQNNTTAVLNTVGRQSVSSLLGFFKGASDAVRTISFLTVSNQIICIDDIERKGQNLRTQDVLGLVSQLRERRKCKVVLILNENELDDPDKKQLARYHEKVIDSSLLFAPTAQDCVDIALPDAKGPVASLAQYVVKLEAGSSTSGRGALFPIRRGDREGLADCVHRAPRRDRALICAGQRQ